MYLLFNKVYILDDSVKYNGKKCIVISNDIFTHDTSDKDILYSASSLNSLLNNHFNGNINEFFSNLLECKDKLYIYCNRFTYYVLQFTLWKSIFKNNDATSLYPLYLTTYDLQSGALLLWERKEGEKVRSPNCVHNWGKLASDEFSIYLDSAFVSKPLVEIDKSKLSLEFLLLYYFKKDSKGYQLLLDRVYTMFTRKVYREYVSLKQDVGRAGYLINKVPGFEDVDTTLGNINESLKANKNTNWVVDDNFSLANIDYCIEHYPRDTPSLLSTYIYFYFTGGVEDIEKYLTTTDKEYILNQEITGESARYVLDSYHDRRLNTHWITYLFKAILDGNKDLFKQYELRDDV